MSTPLGHERQLTFFKRDGHNHDGENSTPIKHAPGSITVDALSDSLLDWIKDLIGGGGGGTTGPIDSDTGQIPVPDLLIETNSVAAGGSVTGSVDWTGISVVRFMRVYMSTDSECTITFYHLPTFAEEDREFRARRCANKFLWEGAWVHYDEADTKKIHYKIENTGTSDTRFQLTLKSGTLVANGYARFVASLGVLGSSVEPSFGDVKLVQGNGMQIIPNGDGTITFSAVAPETISIDRYGLSPQKHTALTSSTTITTTGSGVNSVWGTANYVQFGAGLQWLKADFGAVYTAGRVQVVPYPDSRVVNSAKIEGSTDNLSWTELLSSPTAMSSQTGMLVEIPQGINIRYIRYWANGTSLNTSNYVTGMTIYTISNKVGS